MLRALSFLAFGMAAAFDDRSPLFASTPHYEYHWGEARSSGKEGFVYETNENWEHPDGAKIGRQCFLQVSEEQPDNNWCGSAHPGQRGFSASTGEIAEGVWKGDGKKELHWQTNRQKNGGWHFAHIHGRAYQCYWAAAQGGFQEIYFDGNNCFLAMSHCWGSFRGLATSRRYKMVKVDCDNPQQFPVKPNPSPTAPFTLAKPGNNWCAATWGSPNWQPHVGQQFYDQSSGDAIAKKFGGNWRWDNKKNGGWRFCGRYDKSKCEAACREWANYPLTNGKRTQCYSFVMAGDCCFMEHDPCVLGDQRTNSPKYINPAHD